MLPVRLFTAENATRVNDRFPISISVSRHSVHGQLRSSGDNPTALPDAIVVLHWKARVWYHITTLS
jgi:hypothetical protein